MTEEERKALVEVAKILAPEIYGDALKPAMKQVGKALGTVFEFGNVILLPFELVNAHVQRVRTNYIEKLHSKLEAIEDAQVVEIIPEIAAPVLQKLEYSTNDDLIELFLNLLASASNSQTENVAHPSFVNVISNLSADEAKILNYMFQEGKAVYTVHIRLRYKTGSYSDHNLDTTIFAVKDIIQFPNRMKVYISNLVGLGIIREYGVPTGQAEYDEIEKYLEKDRLEIEKSRQDIRQVGFQRGNYGLTDYGKLFLECCMKKNA